MGGNKVASAEGQAPLPHQLFHYDPSHQVLVCIRCRYAIQPDAIPRHLKDIHHIYRNKRRAFIDHASKLELKKPHEVTPPRPDQFPVRYIEVEQGWRCEAPDCGHLCVSTKRMQAHWSLEHGRKGIQDSDYISVPLQTFFRGNLLRYFTNDGRNASVQASVVELPPVSDVRLYRSNSGRLSLLQKLRRKYDLHSLDTMTLEHYFSSAYKSFAINNETERIWQEVVPSLAYTNQFLLHGMLSCASLHMASLNPKRRQEYILQACAHQDHALPLFRAAIESPNAQNCDAMVVFAYFLVVYTLASDSDSSNHSLLFINDQSAATGTERLVLPQWLNFIRAGCSMLCDVWNHIEAGPVSKLAMAWEVQFQVGDCKLPYLEHFLGVIPGDSSWTDEDTAVYERAANLLARSFAHIDIVSEQSDVSTWDVLSVWPLCVEDAYMELLYDRHPGALILLAYYCIILKRMQSCWYFEQGAMKLLISIVELLDERWHPCIALAVDRVVGSWFKMDFPPSQDRTGTIGAGLNSVAGNKKANGHSIY